MPGGCPSGLNSDGCSDRDHVEKLPDVLILKSDTTHGPVTCCAAAVDEDLASDWRIPWWTCLFVNSPDDLLVLRAAYESVG